MYGAGIGTGYIGPMACAMKWFPKWKGLAMAPAVSFCLVLACFQSDLIQTAFINPGNAKPSYAPYDTDPDEKYFIDAGVLDRIPYSFLVIGVIYAAILLISSLLIFNPPKPQENKHVPRVVNCVKRTFSKEILDIQIHC